MVETARRNLNNGEQDLSSKRMRPICVDLDGTLLRTDTLYECIFQLLRESPFMVFMLPFWVLRGKAHLKAELASRVELRVEDLPYNHKVISFLRKQQMAGRKVILATGAHAKIARDVANHLRLFHRVYATDRETNLVGSAKRRLLTEKFGVGGYDYVGDSRADLEVWRDCQTAFVVDASPRTARIAKKLKLKKHQVLSEKPSTLKSTIRTLRVHQWAKNVLIVLPAFATPKLPELSTIAQATLAFLAFSLMASCIYIINDFFDIGADRRHPEKRKRPIPAGDVSFSKVATLIPLLFGLGLALGSLVNSGFRDTLLAYVAVSTVYTLVLKKFAILDVLILAMLFTGRLYAGAVAAEVSISPWLLSFTLCFFLSLAYVKRVSELLLLEKLKKSKSERRGYVATDILVVLPFGIASGYLAVLILSLYIRSPEIHQTYTHPDYLWAYPPILLYWISRIWLQTARGEIQSDPIQSVGKDPGSWFTALIVLAVWVMATF